jgi:signal transduction histidine kinase
VVDGLLALAIGLIGFGRAHADGVTWLFELGLVLPLIWRRRAPLVVFTVIALVAFAQWLQGSVVPGDIALLVALYTVAAYEALRWTVAATALVEVGAALAVLRWAPEERTIKSFILLSGCVTAAVVIGLNMRTRRAYLASVVDRAERLERERDQQAQIAAANERARIAREMHDVVTHNLSVMIALADGAKFAMTCSPGQAESAMEQVSMTGRQALSDMRRLLGVLKDDRDGATLQPQPGLGEIEELVQAVRAAGLETTFSVSGRPADVPPGPALTLYRVVQEALTNTLKHSPHATHAHVRLRFDGDAVAVEVVDNGTDETVSASAQTGHGIAGMRERAELYGGTVDTGPVPGGGWRVFVELHALEGSRA